MTFVKGQSGNPAGKPKGTVNKTTSKIRDAISAALDQHAGNLGEWLDEVANGRLVNGVRITPGDKKEAIECYNKLAEYAIPKLARTEHVGDDQGGPMTFIMKWGGDGK